MVEEPCACHDHNHIEFVRGRDNILIAQRAAGLGHVAYAALLRPVEAVPKGEKRIRAKRDTRLLTQPGSFFFSREAAR